MTRTSDNEELEQLFADSDSSIVAKRWTAHRIPRGLIYPKLSRIADKEFLRRSVKGWRAYLKSMKDNSHKLKRQGLLIKCIRANLMVDWLANRLNYTVALIVRHPCAVVESKYRLGKIWDPGGVIDRYRSNTKLHELTNGRYESLLAGALSTIEAHCLNWVIENQWPVENQKNGGYSITFYEDLLDETKDGWHRLCKDMGLAKAPSAALIEKPSQQSSRKSSKTASHGSLPIWQRNLDRAQLDEIQRILDKTGCNLYSVEEICPL